MNNETQQIFVYGSLRSGFHHPAFQYLFKYFHLIGDAKVQGVLYDNGDYPVAKPTSEEKFIVGELYQINSPVEFPYAIEQLDDYEGIIVEVGEMPMYKRELVTVLHNGQPQPAWIYWYNGNTQGLPEIPSGDALLFMQQKNKL